jgi:hypothetical protein
MKHKSAVNLNQAISGVWTHRTWIHPIGASIHPITASRRKQMARTNRTIPSDEKDSLAALWSHLIVNADSETLAL